MKGMKAVLALGAVLMAGQAMTPVAMAQPYGPPPPPGYGAPPPPPPPPGYGPGRWRWHGRYWAHREYVWDRWHRHRYWRYW